jgi:hypothetical protein
MSNPKLPAVVFRAAVLAGALVGMVDGVRAAVLGHVGLPGLLSCVALTLGFDVLVAVAGGAALALLIWVSAWGRRQNSGMARLCRWLASGGGRRRGRGCR